MTSTGIALIVIAAVVIAVLGWYLYRERRSKLLRSRFGPEYDYTLRTAGSRTKAEDALLERQRRVEKIRLRPLSPDEHARFADQWHYVQARFVDDPPESIAEADRLVCEVMRARGYPMTEFERRAEDLSVDHPHVVRNYRAAHAVAMRHERGEASTEDLRKALVYYRDLFDELLETRMVGHREH